ncbi:pyrin-like [Saccostrea cucullata]|uniref:pyrin-like n=1 Tax=Saccostrea cuccullata TaxID=36930 RepID=UPI002ED3E654
MDPKLCAQDILRCDLCEDRVVQMYCNLCPMNLCMACVGRHVFDVSKKHDMVPFDLRKSKLVYPQCITHSEENCEMHCEDCNTPVCPKCVISEKHKRHRFKSLQDLVNSKKENIEKERKRLKETVYSTFEEIVTDIETKLAEIDGKYEKLISEVTNHGEEWHREMDKVIVINKEEINEKRNQHRDALNKHLQDIKKLVADVKQSISETEDILQSKEVTRSLSYEIKSEKFTKLPSKLIVKFPVFTGNNNQLKYSQLFCSITPLSITKEEHGYRMKTPEAVSCPPVKPLLDESELISTIDTGFKGLYSVTCLSDEEIWTHEGNKIMKLHNLQGKLLKSIQTKSGKMPRDIAVTRSGDLVYTSPDTRTVNIVKNDQIQEVIRLQGENRNLDICVADNGARAVVVVNKAGKLRFRYTGQLSTTKRYLFNPYGITTDSQSQILTSDFIKNFIHILDQDGQFLCYIDNCGLQHPYGLCVDNRDNHFVAECSKGKVKKIKYM